MGSLGCWTKSPKSLGIERTKGADTSSLAERGRYFAGDGDSSFLCVEARVGCDYVWRERDGEGETSTRPIASVHHYYLLSTVEGHA